AVCSSGFTTDTVTWKLVRGAIDDDHDGVPDSEDNCKPSQTPPGATRNIALNGDPELLVPAAWNIDQKDTDGNGIGDACDNASGGGGGGTKLTEIQAVQQYAPFVVLHPRELFYPLGTDQFVRFSRLRFAHDAG